MSRVVKLHIPDDYLAPSSACVKPFSFEKKSDTKRKIEFEGSTVTPELKKIEKPEKVQISLKDCLSCSGCITSSEVVLVAEQSLNFFYDFLSENKMLEKDKRKLIAISISPQTKASIAVKNNLSYEETSKKLNIFLKRMGADIVLDTTVGRELSLLESGKEFVRHFREQNDLPLFTSACPAWVSYVEKSMEENTIKHMSLIKSAQQMTATIIKNHLAGKLGVKNATQVFHVSVAPCYDRKLEASRNDFYDEELACKDVDCVLTSGELQEMIEKEGISLAELDYEDSNNLELLEYPECWSHEKSESDGYMNYVVKYAAKELFNKDLDVLEYKVLRHSDMQEVLIYDDHESSNNADGSNKSSNGNMEAKKPLLRFAFAYGFRKLQDVARKFKRKQLPYDYIEVMACPTGCLNGGGQIQTKSLPKVREEYNSIAKQPVGVHPAAVQLYSEWLDGLSQEEFNKMTKTQFRHVPKTNDFLDF